MKKTILGLVLCGLAVSGVAADRHAPLTVAGRPYWSVLGYDALDCTAGTNRTVFGDFLPVFHSDLRPPMPDRGLAAWRTVRENFARKSSAWDRLEAYAATGRPFSLGFTSKRNSLVFGGAIDLDRADYEAWRKSHPGLAVFHSLGEWDNDLLHAYSFVRPPKDEAKRQDLLEFFGLKGKDPAIFTRRQDEVSAFLGPAPTNRTDRVALYRKYVDRIAALHYGDRAHMAELHASINIAHLAAQWGLGALALETTNTSGGDLEYRWAVSGLFIRGAARQFRLPWMWYTAIYMNGYDADGRWVGNSVCNYLRTSEDSHYHGAIGPDGGVSRSLNRRIWYYAYLNGANAIEQEGWKSVFTERDPATGRLRLSPRGEDFADFHDFTRAHPDRGTTHTPVAVLVPNDRGYTTYGGAPFGNPAMGYTPGDETVDAVFFTLQPTFERDAAMRRGTEANLYNSPLAMMYDAITPDAGQDPAERLATFQSYRALVVTGDYADTSFERELAQYEKEGGKVIRITAADLPARKGAPGKVVAEVLAGRRTYPAVAAKLRALQDEFFPFEVSGDCLYGANRTERGWWLWVFNNKGVVKFANAPELKVPRMATAVSVRAKAGAIASAIELVSGKSVEVKDGAFSARLPPGEFAIFEIGR